MSEEERMLARLGDVLARIARPHRCDESIPVDLQARLWRLGVPCSEATPREDLISQLWARKRILQLTLQPIWGGPGATPPAAA